MKCLNCNAEMARVEMQSPKATVAYDLCETCGSLWLDAGQMDKIAYQVRGSIEQSSQEAASEPEARAQKCPCCDNADLIRVRFLDCTDILLHHCQSCRGYWLDGGELDRMDKELAADGPVRNHGFADFIYNQHLPYWVKRVRSTETLPRQEAMPIDGAERTGSAQGSCPACGTPLAAYAVFGMNFSGCPVCKGSWLYRDELRQLKNTVEEGSLRWLNDEVEDVENVAGAMCKRLCPVCQGQKLMATRFGKSSASVDWCPQCRGMWLDRGELDTIVDYLRRELESAHSGEIEKRLLQAVRRVWKGGGEGRREELLDLKATIAALVHATEFEHSRLAVGLAAGARTL
ncbi:MAG: zf-TFIIB domain-containing protein [Terriglobales bacterium]